MKKKFFCYSIRLLASLKMEKLQKRLQSQLFDDESSQQTS